MPTVWHRHTDSNRPEHADPSALIPCEGCDRWTDERSEPAPTLGAPNLQVLNDCPGGYAVGIAGFVALLPYSRAKAETVEDIGSSQTFEIVSMDEARKRIVVGDFRRKQ